MGTIRRLQRCVCVTSAAVCPSAEEGASGAFSWKGRGAAVSELLSIYTRHSADPPATLAHLATTVLPMVPAKVRLAKAGHYILYDACDQP